MDTVTRRRFLVASGVVGAAALLVSWLVGFGSIGGIVLLVVTGIALVTAAVGYCPAYRLFKFSTNPSFHKTSTREVTIAHR